MSLQCASPRPPHSEAFSLLLCRVEGGRGGEDPLLPRIYLSWTLSRTVPDLTIAPSLSAAFQGQICVVCSSEEEETGQIYVLLFGPQGGGASC